MGTHILELKTVSLRGTVAVGIGVDERGRAFEIVLDLGLAADIAAALDDGQRPIVSMENGFFASTSKERATVDQVLAQTDAGDRIGEAAGNPGPTQSLARPHTGEVDGRRPQIARRCPSD